MNVIENFEAEASGERLYKELAKLEKGKLYQIENLRFIDSKFGQCLAADLENYEWTILPKRLLQMVPTQAELDKLVRKQYKMRYLGVEPKKGKIQLVQFIPSQDVAENDQPIADVIDN